MFNSYHIQLYYLIIINEGHIVQEKFPGNIYSFALLILSGINSARINAVK